MKAHRIIEGVLYLVTWKSMMEFKLRFVYARSEDAAIYQLCDRLYMEKRQ